MSIAIETRSIIRRHAGGRPIGVDVGIAHFATLSDGDTDAHIPNIRPRSAREKAMRTIREGRWRAAPVDRGIAGRLKAALAQLQRPIAAARATYQHRVSARLTRDHPMIFVEALRVKNMLCSAAGTVEAPGTNVAAKRGLNRAMTDVAMAKFIQLLTFKAARAGGILRKVDARYTSQACSA